MSDEAKYGIFAIGVIVGMLFGVAMGTTLTTSCYHEEAIRHGYAEYNSKTGEWHWKVEKNEKE